MKFIKGLLLAVALQGLGACAFTDETIDVRHVPVNAAPITGADKAAVGLKTADARVADRIRVSHKMNGYGMDTANIVTSRPVAVIVQDAFNAELTVRGFSVVQTGPKIELDVGVVRFFNKFTLGFLSGDADAEVVLDVAIKSVGFARQYVGRTHSNVMLAGGNNAKLELERSLAAAVLQAFLDQDFIAALLRAPIPTS